MFENFVLFAVFFNGYLLGKQATGYVGGNSQFFLFFLFFSLVTVYQNKKARKL